MLLSVSMTEVAGKFNVHCHHCNLHNFVAGFKLGFSLCCELLMVANLMDALKSLKEQSLK